MGVTGMKRCPNCGNEFEVIGTDTELWYYCDKCDKEFEYDEEEDGDCLSVYEAADIWASNGKDEDYTFGYSEEELEEALNS